MAIVKKILTYIEFFTLLCTYVWKFCTDILRVFKKFKCKRHRSSTILCECVSQSEKTPFVTIHTLTFLHMIQSGILKRLKCWTLISPTRSVSYCRWSDDALNFWILGIEAILIDFQIKHFFLHEMIDDYFDSLIVRTQVPTNWEGLHYIILVKGTLNSFHYSVSLGKIQIDKKESIQIARN